jgi:hypothetical protein
MGNSKYKLYLKWNLLFIKVSYKKVCKNVIPEGRRTIRNLIIRNIISIRAVLGHFLMYSARITNPRLPSSSKNSFNS